jgi:sortase A
MTRIQKRGLVLILVGLVMVFAATGLHLTETRQDAIAGENSQILLQYLAQTHIPVQVPATDGDLAMLEREDGAPIVTKMPEREYLGYAMIGTVRVPSVGIQLPVMSKWSYSLLNVAPCRYTGSVPGEDMIVMGHNYKSHFTPLHKVELDAEVEFEDVNGVVYCYRVAEIVTLHKSEKAELPSEYPLTLFTCMPNGRDRLIVRCEKTEEA